MTEFEDRLAAIRTRGGGALDDLCRMDDEFGAEPADVRWYRHRAHTVSRAWEEAWVEVERLRAAVEAVLAALDKTDAHPGPDGERKVHTVVVRQAIAAAGYPTETKEDERG